MSGRFLNMIKEVTGRVVFNSDLFTTQLLFTNKDGEEFIVQGLAIVHSTVNDIDGSGKFKAIGDTSMVTFLESDLKALGAVVRNADGNNIMTGWTVSFTLETGEYVAKLAEPVPDSTLGVTRFKITVYGED